MSSRTPLIAGNWKLNHGGPSACDLARQVLESTKQLREVHLVVAPPFTALAAVAHELTDSSVEVAAQNLYPKDSGAFTGEVSAPMLLDAGCRWVILGHSERRQHFQESDALVAEKVSAAIAAQLRPIVCVGETLEEREAGKTLDVVFRQLDAVTEALNSAPAYGVVAYEPVWAIGTGKVAGPEQAQEVHAAIRTRLAAVSEQLGETTRILYGGSVKPSNAQTLLACPDIDGALVGGASLKADDFAQIATATQS